jgi:hypothetical protein
MKQLSYGVKTDKKILREADLWCQEQWGERWKAVGNREGTWCVFWAGTRENLTTQYQWWFETEEQQLMFILRWT